MNTSPDTKDIFAALAKAQGEMRGATKDASNPHFRSKYADLASVWDACREPLAKNGLCVIQSPGNDEQGLYIETTLGHISGQWVSGKLHVSPVKNDPQGIGSAITYGRRYALQSVVGIAPEDDDGESAMGRKKADTEADNRRDDKSETVASIKDWRTVVCHIGKPQTKGKKLGELTPDQLRKAVEWLRENAESADDRKMLAACEIGMLEVNPVPGTKSAHAKPTEPDEIPMHHARDRFKTFLEFAGFSTEEFMTVAKMSKWVAVESFADISEESFAKMQEASETTILPALDQWKKGAK